jgi:hypothetical protein
MENVNYFKCKIDKNNHLTLKPALVRSLTLNHANGGLHPHREQLVMPTPPGVIPRFDNAFILGDNAGRRQIQRTMFNHHFQLMVNLVKYDCGSLRAFNAFLVLYVRS